MPRKKQAQSKGKRKPHAVPQRVGRKTLLTPELQAEIEQILKEGHYQSVAIDIVGISQDCYYRWLREGERAKAKIEDGGALAADEQRYYEFYETVKKAIAFGIRRDINRIDLAGEQDWKAIAWKRERMNPDLFALRGRVDINQNTNINHNVNINHDIKVELSNANAGTVLDIMAECGAIPPPARGIEREAEVE